MGIGGAPYKKNGSILFNFFIFLQLKATSPPQELEVGAHRAPYLLVTKYST